MNGPKTQVEPSIRKTGIAGVRTTQPQATKSNASSNRSSTASKTKTIAVTKMTKLVLKPPSQPKIPSAGKVTIKKYITKPVTTIKSRSTLSVSHSAAYRVRDISKVAVDQKRPNAQPTNARNIGHSDNAVLIKSTENANEESQQPFDMGHGDGGKPVVNTSTFDIPILQEITSTVVNCSTAQKVSGTELDDKISPKKCKESSENEQKSKLKAYDPFKARQFIQKQKEKRKELAQDKSKIPISKQEIKQRLSALHKNSLQILGKNVKRARENSEDRGNTSKTTQIETKPKPKTPLKGLFKVNQIVSIFDVIYVIFMNFQRCRDTFSQPHRINRFQ